MDEKNELSLKREDEANGVVCVGRENISSSGESKKHKRS